MTNKEASRPENRWRSIMLHLLIKKEVYIMSRIGKLPIVIPAGVTVTISGNEVKVKGPRGIGTDRIARN